MGTLVTFKYKTKYSGSHLQNINVWSASRAGVEAQCPGGPPTTMNLSPKWDIHQVAQISISLSLRIPGKASVNLSYRGEGIIPWP